MILRVDRIPVDGGALISARYSDDAISCPKTETTEEVRVTMLGVVNTLTGSEEETTNPTLGTVEGLKSAERLWVNPSGFNTRIGNPIN